MHRPLIDADALALRWCVTTHHVYRLAREGRIPAVKLGRYYRFSLPALEAFEARGGIVATD
jgi:excisionase family DNA binding protein